MQDKKAELRNIFVDHSVAVAYLFGSQVEGYADSLSDLDLGVLFNDKNPSIIEVLELQADLQKHFAPIRVDLIQLEKAPNNIVFSAISRGKLIHSTNEKLRLTFEEDVLRIYHDFTPFMESFYYDLQKAMQIGDLND